VNPNDGGDKLWELKTYGLQEPGTIAEFMITRTIEKLPKSILYCFGTLNSAMLYLCTTESKKHSPNLYF